MILLILIFSNNSTTILYILEIYYVSKEEKILCEKWTFQFDSNFFSESKNSTFKLNTLLRLLIVYQE